MKALHFRNAYAAWEKHSYTKFQDLKMIPSNEEIVDIGNGLFMTDKGTVWTKGGNVSRSKSQVLLGTAFVSMGMKLGELSP